MNHPLQLHTKHLYSQLVIAIWLFFQSLYLYPAVYESNSEQAVTVNASGIEIKLYTYRPACNHPSILFVFHGLNRKAANARDNAKNIANEECLMVFAPLFDKDRFPNWRYHRAGVVRKNRVQPKSQWTAALLKSLIDFSRDYINNPNAKVYLFGHSAGAQFLSRIMAYAPLRDVERVVLANPSVFVAPTLTVEAPYGFAGVFSTKDAQRHLANYLSSPITVYLGSNDTGEKYLAKGKMANQQGANRLERGNNVFHKAKLVANKNSMAFGWRLVEACGIGHSSAGMLTSPTIHYALGLRDLDLTDSINMCRKISNLQ